MGMLSLPNTEARIDLSAQLFGMRFFGTDALLALAPQATAPGTNPNPTAQLVQMLATFVFFGVVFYFVLIRPQQKKAKDHAELLKTLKSGDKIVTNGGILGVVVSIKENTVTIRSADTKLEVLKSSVTDISERSSTAST
jgi:preprotein translocase subunit YajC